MKISFIHKKKVDEDLLLWSYKDLFHLLKTDSPCLASIGSLVDDILFVKNSCHVCQFNFVKSLCNKAILALATEALSSVSSQV
jgi:hypothetical protein